MNQKGFINILLIIIVVALVGAGVYFVSTKQITPLNPIPTYIPSPTPTPTPSPTPNTSPIPKPSSTPTPTPVPSGEKIIRKVGERESSFLIQKINPDSVEGLWADEYPIPMLGDGTPRTIRIGDDIGYACTGVSEKLISINFSGQTITFNKVIGERPVGGCPICLAGNSFIDTPSGLALVKDLQIGMAVWTTDKTGQRVSGVLTKNLKVPVPSTHQMVRLILDDGRELLVSPGHPTIDGRTIGDFVSGELYDGATIISTTRVPYGDGATYDLLPSGDTGFYWANGILMGSTLR